MHLITAIGKVLLLSSILKEDYEKKKSENTIFLSSFYLFFCPFSIFSLQMLLPFSKPH